MSDFNFFGPKFNPERDMRLFEDDDGDTNGSVLPLDPTWTTMAHVMHHIGAFPSITQASKAGWGVPIPAGWSEFRLPKRFNGSKLYIDNPSMTFSEFIIEDAERD